VIAGNTQLSCTRNGANNGSRDVNVGEVVDVAQIVLRAPTDGSTQMTNIAQVTLSGQAGSYTTDPVSENNIESVTAYLSNDVDLTIAYTSPSSSQTFNSGDIVSYLLQVTNLSGAGATGFVVADQMPAGYTAIDATGTDWVCSITGNLATCTYSGPGITPGNSASIITVRVAGPNSGSLSNSASVAASASQNDTNPSNNGPVSISNNFISCNRNVVDASLSTVAAITDTDVLTNTSLDYTDILVTLKNNCTSSPIFTGTVNVTLNSSVGGSDTIAVAPGYANPVPGTGQIVFRIQSATVGTRTYSAVAGSTTLAATVNSVVFYGCPTITNGTITNGVWNYNVTSPGSPNPISHKLIQAVITFAASNGRKMSNIKTGAAGNIVWSDSNGVNPGTFTVDSSGSYVWTSGSDTNRTWTNNGSTSLLTFSLNGNPTTSSGTMVLTFADPNVNARQCTMTITK
jgi:uncharacterized repeat protein (TIGR01451 family)